MHDDVQHLWHACLVLRLIEAPGWTGAGATTSKKHAAAYEPIDATKILLCRHRVAPQHEQQKAFRLRAPATEWSQFLQPTPSGASAPPVTASSATADEAATLAV